MRQAYYQGRQPAGVWQARKQAASGSLYTWWLNAIFHAQDPLQYIQYIQRFRAFHESRITAEGKTKDPAYGVEMDILGKSMDATVRRNPALQQDSPRYAPDARFAFDYEMAQEIHNRVVASMERLGLFPRSYDTAAQEYGEL